MPARGHMGDVMNSRSLKLTLLIGALVLAGCPLNTAPIADAGPDQTVVEGTQVVLDGKGTDQTGEVVKYTWTQTAGPKVKFKAQKNRLSFIAPQTDVQLTLEFSLTVTDQFGAVSKPDTVKVIVNQIKFFGTAPGGPEDYEHLLTYFDQLTPENAGKWGSVEATRDVMNWDELDTAYNFARDHGIPFKFHTLLWGQQQPGWIASLSAKEQLAEIDEWMKAVAKRYRDLKYVEVLNEPINAPPAYAAALGGAGKTGYDWIIKAFQMARKHFPKAQLILNEYNTIHLEQFTHDYLTIIQLLKDRGLIDAVGEQAHFLERAEPEIVAANLDMLASAGLPIYISEFDLNFADDARQANVMRDLFPIFWNHPQVAGVTHWGHLQGSIWRTNAYLLRSDGSTRPALDFILCYIDGGGDSCMVPDYVPAGWRGNEFGVTMEAEEYDEGSGVAALGGVVAYTDANDWIAFKDVEFQQGWDTFWVTYAKGNTDLGSISVHLDSLENAPVITVPLPPTSGWGSNDTIEEAWPALMGTHDVYIRFNDVSGVANLDNIRFGKPQPSSGVNLVVDGGFESGAVTGWQSWNGSTLIASSAQAHSGHFSLLATARPNANQFAVYNLTSVVRPGTTYQVGAWALHAGADPTTIRLAAKVECTPDTAPDGHNAFPWLDNKGAVAPHTWTQYSAALVIPDCDLVDVAIFFEGTPPGIDVYLDDIEVVPPGENLVADGSFETGVAGWQSWAGATLLTSTAQARTGAQSLLATNRTNDAQFAVYSLTGRVTRNTTYSVTAWALIGGAATDTVRLAAKVECSGSDAQYPWLHNNTEVVPGSWTLLSGELQIPDCDVADALIFFEGTSAGTDVYLDDVAVLR